MGQYNPHKPSILGQEWAPVRELPYLLDTETERGVTFILDHAAAVVSGAVYIADVPANQSTKGVMMAVYEAGTEHLTGPIQRVVVPPVSGVWRLLDTDSELEMEPDGATVAQALTSPNDAYFVAAEDNVELYLFFDTSTVASQLSGKRILEVNILYTMSGTQSGAPGPSPDSPVSHRLSVFRGNPDTAIGATIVNQGTPVIGLATNTVPEINRVRLGNSNIFAMFTSCADAGSANGPSSLFFPVRQADLANFDLGTPIAQRLSFEMVQSDGCFGCAGIGEPDNVYSYCAMEILYCEETRLLYGSRGRYMCPPWDLNPGQNRILLRAPSSFAAGATLQPGEYTVTVSMADMGDYQNGLGGNYSATALLQRYPIPTHAGVVIDTRAREGATFRRETSNLLPRITLHTSSGVVTGVHTYDTLASAPVYDGVDVGPDVVERALSSATPYPQVRFYARRFGNTDVPLVLRQQASPSTRVQISADEFDALPEIVDGWREVTLRFPDDDLPTFGTTGGSQTWEWVADGLDANNQWEILVPYGASASTGPFDTSNATYGGFSAWTQVGATALNNDADATLIFSQDPPAVTGLAVEVLEQSLEPVGAECAVEPSCIPTALYYNHLTWNALDALDLFEDRDSVNGWGEAPSGQTWSHTGGTIDDYLVVSGVGRQRVDAVNTLMFSVIEANAYNVEVRGRVRLPVMPVGQNATLRVAGRLEDVNNYYEAQLVITPTGDVSVLVTKRVSGTGTVISPTVTVDATHSAGDVWNIVLRCQGEQILGRAWKDGYPEPLAWQAVGVTLPGDGITGTSAAAIARAETGVSNTPWNVDWFDFSATNLDVVGFELERRDDVDDEWQAIMRSTGTAVNEFNDYEARVGVNSDYRIRTFNALDFYGPWTAASGSLPAPGVVGDGPDGNSVLLFTTNEVQDGSSNLAYVMVWSGDVSEDFSFPESGTVQLRDVFRRDYPVAFRPLERGGERFSRDIIVQNAAVPTGRMRDGFRSLRDLAWEDVSYVAVRNELGDRWLANVTVPSGKILRNRRLYIARIDIAEVSATPSVVDPGV